jgi:hypothetical protein
VVSQKRHLVDFVGLAQFESESPASEVSTPAPVERPSAPPSAAATPVDARVSEAAMRPHATQAPGEMDWLASFSSESVPAEPPADLAWPPAETNVVATSCSDATPRGLLRRWFFLALGAFVISAGVVFWGLRLLHDRPATTPALLAPSVERVHVTDSADATGPPLSPQPAVDRLEPEDR